MEEFIGKLWHNWVTRTAAGHYPDAAVTLADVEKRPASCSAPSVVIPASRWLPPPSKRTAPAAAGCSDWPAQTNASLRAGAMPKPCACPEIAAFPEKSLNRDLYLWLAALAASDVAPTQPWFVRNQLASRTALERYPGLNQRYRRLVAAHLAGRIDPDTLQADEAAQEHAIRQALQQPGSVTALPPLNTVKSTPPQPVLLWLIGADTIDNGVKLADPNETLPREGSGGNTENAKEAHKAEQVETPDNKNPMLAMFRAESLPTWAEYVRVNRAYDDNEDPNASDAARDLDKLSLTRDGETAKSRVKFDLDLPSAAEDDTPIGPGISQPEWDYRKNVMQPAHCLIVPMMARDAGQAALPPELAATARKLRGQFAALAPQRRWLKGQPDGPELDVDSCVRNHADRASGHTPEAGGYLAQARCERDLACLLLADLSMSTDAPISDSHRIVDVIRDSLLLFSEALTATGDRFGIYGFSSLRRQNIRFHLLKDFNGKYDAAARARILAIKPGFYTRMGAAIRQSASILAEQPASRRLLLIITDGKPNDLDIYDSRYGIEDTRMAVHEARRLGLTPFCVTIDSEAGAYLPYLFGPAGFCVIRKPEELPSRLPLLYVQLTRQ
jgi:nitric oxide reductase NorD protein